MLCQALNLVSFPYLTTPKPKGVEPQDAAQVAVNYGAYTTSYLLVDFCAIVILCHADSRRAFVSIPIGLLAAAFE